MSCHALFAAGAAIGWFGLTDVAEAQQFVEACAQALGLDDGGVCPDLGPGYQDVDANMDKTQRQSTHRANAKLWLGTRPSARLWILHELCQQQQRQLKDMLKCSGPKWETEQLAKGAAREFRPLLALNGTWTKPSLTAYGRMLTEDGPWRHIPDQYRTSHLAAAAFRATSRSASAVYQLLAVRHRMYPFKGFGLLLRGAAAAECAAEMLDDYTMRPCVMDPFFFELCRKCQGHAALLLAPASLAIVSTAATLSETDNATTEANNACIRRRVKQHLQRLSPETQDVTADWVFKWSRQERDSIFGQQHAEDHVPAEGRDDNDDRKMHGGVVANTEHSFQKKIS